MITAVVLISCIPTEPCACPPQRTWFLLSGTVERPDGSLVAGARVRVTSVLMEGAACATQGRNDVLDPTELSTADGRFRNHLFSVFEPGVRCLSIRAFAGAAGFADSSDVAQILASFTTRSVPDSIGVRLTIP